MDVKKFYSTCLQGDVLKAIEYLKSFKNKSEDIIMLEKQYEKRFLNDSEDIEINTDDPWIKEVVNCYFNYFRSVLVGNSIEVSESYLINSLLKLINVSEGSSLDDIEMELEKIFREKGYSFLGGITPPYRGPYIWKTTLKKEFNVDLLDRQQKVTVYFLSDFLMLGWIHFATMGKHYPGGWAKPEGLYYVDNESNHIDINSSEFQIWFLKHEAQHLSDYKEFPNLNPSNLEYRAKIIELIYNPHPHELIEKFLKESKNDKNLPHPYAAFSIIKSLSFTLFGQSYIDDMQKWKNIKPDLISKAAREMFYKNTKSLYEVGNETKGVI